MSESQEILTKDNSRINNASRISKIVVKIFGVIFVFAMIGLLLITLYGTGFVSGIDDFFQNTKLFWMFFRFTLILLLALFWDWVGDLLGLVPARWRSIKIVAIGSILFVDIFLISGVFGALVNSF